jgi:hypothetical protein
MYYLPCEFHQPQPIDVTDLAEWIEDDPNDIIESVVNGLVTMSDTGNAGDTARIYAEYDNYRSNVWHIELIP